MYNVCLFLDNCTLLAKLTALHIWGEDTGFEIEAAVSDFEALKKLLENKKFDLVIAENNLIKYDMCQTFVELKTKKYFGHIALCSVEADFESARKGILIGADDYFTLPFDESLILSLFDRIQNKSGNKQANAQSSIEKFSQKLIDLFLKQDNDLYGYLEYLNKNSIAGQVIDSALKFIFDKNDWFDLFFNEIDYVSSSVPDIGEQKAKFISLFESYSMLFPNHNDTLDNIIKHILYNPESDLRQKTISDELHINKSYLSTVFIAQTNIRFVDYITNVKLMRAAWLLKNTEMKVGEIAQRIDYKDVAYFSKQFKKFFSYSPSEYRLPEDYHFEI